MNSELEHPKIIFDTHAAQKQLHLFLLRLLCIEYAKDLICIEL